MVSAENKLGVPPPKIWRKAFGLERRVVLIPNPESVPVSILLRVIDYLPCGN